jgi:hypothetical protein
VYERLVALVKEAFKSALGRTVLDEEEFRTFVLQIAAAINERPLTVVSTDSEGTHPLRPIDFINHGAEMQLSLPPIPPSGAGAPARELRARLGAQQESMNRLWRRVQHEYLILMRDRSGWHHRNDRGSLQAVPAVGDVVLLEEAGKPRVLWSLAKVTELETRT